MPGGKQASRFEMLLNVSLAGADKVKALGSTAKKAALGMKTLTQALDKINASETAAKQNFKDTIKALDDYIKTYDKYKRALETVNTKMRASNAETKRGQTAIKNARGKVREYTKELTRLKNAVNDMSPGMINMTKRNGTIISQQKVLKRRSALLKDEMKKLGRANQRASRSSKDLSSQQRKTTVTTKESTKAFKQNEFAVDGLRQRLKRSDIPAFRKRLGALRNQILVLTFAFGGLIRAFQRTFEEANILEASMRGLGAVAANTGNGLLASQNAAMQLADSGLLTVQDAAAGLKNLLSAGFGLKEATALMNSLTDAASFNRQGTLSLGQAVVGATQGIKNQNSIMVDNAGITKNLSIMYKEYAESIGTSAGKLDEAQKNQAIFNGILREATVFAGDAERVLQTTAGQIAKLGAESRGAAAGVGRLIQPFAQGFVQALSAGATGLKNLTDELEANTGVQQQLILVGYKTEQAFRSIGDLFGGIGSVLKGLGTNFVGLIGTIIKLGLGFRVLIAVQNRSRAATLKTAEAAATMTEVFDIKTRKAIMGVNKVTGEQISEFQRLRIDILKVTTAVREKTRIEQLNIRTGSRFKDSILKADLAIKGLVLRLKAGVLVMKDFGRMAKIAGIAIRGLVRVVSRFAIQLVAIEALFFVVQKLIGAFGQLFESQDQVKLNTERATTANDALNKSYEATAGSIASAVEAANRFKGVDPTALEEAKDKLDRYKQAVDVAAEELKKASTLDSQATAQEKLDVQQGLYDNALANVKRFQKALETETNAHLSRINAAQTAYNTQYEKSIEALNLKSYNDARTAYASILAQIEEFEATKQSMTDSSGAQILRAEEMLYDARKLAMENFEAERQKILGRGLTEAEKKNEQYTAKLLELDKSEIDRIKSSYREQAKIIKDQLIQNQQAVEQTLNAADRQAKKLFGDTENPLIAAAQAFQASINPMTVGGAGGPSQPYTAGIDPYETAVPSQLDPSRLQTMTSGQQQRILPEVIDSYKEINALLATYGQGLKAAGGDNEKLNMVHEDHRDALLRQQTIYDSLIKRVEEMGYGESALADNLRKTSDGIKTFNSAANKNIEQFKAMTHETKANAAANSELTDETSEAITAMEAYLSQQSALRVSAVQYREDLKGLAIDIKAVAEAEKFGSDQYPQIISANDRRIEQIKDLQGAELQHLGVVKMFTPSLRGMMDLFNSKSPDQFLSKLISLNGVLGRSNDQVTAQALALANFNIKQRNAMNIVKDRKVAAEALVAIEEKQLQTMQNNMVTTDETGQVTGGTYVQADIDRQMKRVEVSQAKVDAINAEVAATERLQTAEGEAFAQGQDIAAMQERIEAFQTMATKFGSFITNMQNMEQKRLNANRAYRIKIGKEIETQKITQEQGNLLMVENAKLTNAQKELDEAKYLASLIRNVGQIIMMESAKRAAQSGNVLAAIGIFGAGLVGMAIANNAANKIEAKAQADYNEAEAEFRSREQEIRGDGEDQETGSAGERRFGGSIKAENLAVTISPTVVVSGEQVFIGQGSVTEFGAEMQALLLTSMQDAIENREIDLSNAANLEG